MTTRQEYINQVVKLGQTLQRTPTRVDVRSHCGLHYKNIQKYFNGNFNNLLIEAGFVPNRCRTFSTTQKCANVNCDNHITNKQYEHRQYCSVRCSNQSRIKHGVYSLVEKSCPSCQIKHNRPVSEYCSNLCKLLFIYSGIKKGDLLVRKGGANVYDLIRWRAKSVAKYSLQPVCYSCGYNKHVEVAHIRPIHQFDDNVTLNIINHPTNITHLCPNCHWEYDNGHLIL